MYIKIGQQPFVQNGPSKEECEIVLTVTDADAQTLRIRSALEEATALLPGELKYRPPTGKPEDRMLALATGRTEHGQKFAIQKGGARGWLTRPTLGAESGPAGRGTFPNGARRTPIGWVRGY
jgi:hypothetical protein